MRLKSRGCKIIIHRYLGRATAFKCGVNQLESDQWNRTHIITR